MLSPDLYDPSRRNGVIQPGLTLRVPSLRESARLALFAFAYFIAFEVGLYFYFEPENVATAWPANGLVVGVLLLSRARSWPTLLTLQALVQLVLDLVQLGNPLSFALFATLANTLATFAIAWASLKVCRGSFRIDRLSAVAAFVMTTLVGEALGALGGATAVTLTYPGQPFWSAWRIWWFGDVIGVWLVAPVILGWGIYRRSSWRPTPPRIGEGVSMITLTAIVSYLVFGSDGGSPFSLFASPYMVAPFLLWSALRFRPAIASSTMLTVGSFVLFFAEQGRGPLVLAGQSVTELVFAVQIFLTFGCLMTLVVAAILAERSAAVTELEASESQFRSLIEHAADPIFVHDLEGRITAVNRAAEALGYTRNELLQMTVFDIDVGATVAEREPTLAMWAEMKEGEAISLEGEHRRKDGHTFPIEARIGRIAGASPPQIVAIVRSTEEWQRREREQIEIERWKAQSQRLEAVGTLAGGIAHDFNNILGVIIGYSELARNELQDGSDVAANLEQVLVAAQRASEMIDRILAFSRPASQGRELLGASSVVRESMKLVAVSMPSTIQIQEHYDPDAGAVLAAPDELHQVVLNLGTNALHALRDQGGRIEVNVVPVEVGGQETGPLLGLDPGPYVLIEVRDDGPGIPPEVLPRIFEPFFTTKPYGEGSGMGLAVAHGVVRDLGGAINVQNGRPRGAVFKVLLPRHPAPAERTAEQTLEAPGGSERILFVDDEPQIVRLGEKMLSRLGYSVEGLSSSEDALGRFLSGPDTFDLLITDQTMPGLTGLELARRVLAVRSDLPVILCSGYSDLVDRQTAGELGLLSFLHKPITLNRMATAVREALDREQE